MNPSLFAELERLFHSKEAALYCAVSHEQVTVDGFTIKLTDDRRWTRRQLSGRLAACNHRRARLFDGSPRTVDIVDIQPRTVVES